MVYIEFVTLVFKHWTTNRADLALKALSGMYRVLQVNWEFLHTLLQWL